MPRQFQWGISFFVTNGVGTTGQSHAKEGNYTLPHAIYKVNAKRIKYLHVFILTES